MTDNSNFRTERTAALRSLDANLIREYSQKWLGDGKSKLHVVRDMNKFWTIVHKARTGLPNDLTLEERLFSHHWLVVREIESYLEDSDIKLYSAWCRLQVPEMLDLIAGDDWMTAASMTIAMGDQT